MKKLLIFAVIFVMMFLMASVCFAEVKKPEPNTYGMVFMYVDNAPLAYTFIKNTEIDENYICELNYKSVGLVNRGEIIEIQMRIPLKDSRVVIYYKEHIYYFKLKVYAVGKNYILFIFKGVAGD